MTGDIDNYNCPNMTPTQVRLCEFYANITCRQLNTCYE